MSSTRLWYAIIAVVAGPIGVRAQSDPSNRESELRVDLARYRNIASQGGWAVIPSGPALESGTRDPRVPVLRDRLRAEGYPVQAADPDPSRYDPDLEALVRRFQGTHGLEQDGVVGPSTLAALNVAAGARAAQIEANLDPRRLVPDLLGDRYIVVNSAAFALDLIDGGRSILRLRTIVGRPDWPTPMASSRITEVIFRPVWRIPKSIATREILPIARRDVGYFARTVTRAFRESVGAVTEIDPAEVDWSAVPAREFPYQLAQEPGPSNPLGGVKLVFRTPYDVYLHDTPNAVLFAKRRRTFSHGCIRVENISRLMAYLLPEWTADSIARAMTIGREQRVPLAAPTPVHLVYWTAWREDDGLVAFREDVYRRDRRSRAAYSVAQQVNPE